ncbi:porin family protein [Roseibacterium sp. SDUM158016]|uniref:outer membrane protein n=1 Tax=Roseicyclus sediminis TaxID=2980997 RepID=UPI0021D306C8|nr:porin family protein [Roseibacterium sp. SDUM158016]MCU4653602.1 porin family protein [Roseibacterium sp. SDUM158016]
MKQKTTAALAALLAMGAFPALAGGVAEPAPAPAVIPVAPAPMPSADWTGFYAGGQLEYGDVDVSGVATDNGTGALGGFFAGYRYDFGSYVIGGEIDLNLADIDLPGVGGTLDSVARAGIEAGFDAGPALIYGTVGAAYATVDAGANTLDGTGYFYGIGMDYALTDRVTVGAELLQHEFRDFDNTTGLDVDAMTFGINAALRF